jgi:hypothetical protein
LRRSTIFVSFLRASISVVVASAPSPISRRLPLERIETWCGRLPQISPSAGSTGSSS